MTGFRRGRCLPALEHSGARQSNDAGRQMKRYTSQRQLRLLNKDLYLQADVWFAWADANPRRMRLPTMAAAVRNTNVLDEATSRSDQQVRQ